MYVCKVTGHTLNLRNRLNEQPNVRSAAQAKPEVVDGGVAVDPLQVKLKSFSGKRLMSVCHLSSVTT